MCEFLSLVSNGKVGSVDGKLLYFDWELRKKCLSKELKYEPDSHTSIADYYGYRSNERNRITRKAL